LSPDYILHNATIYTVDRNLPWASAAAIKGKRFVAVGDDEDVLIYKSNRTRLIDLGGRFVLPGICDAHIHFYDWSLSLDQVSLSNCQGKDELAARVLERARTSAGGRWIIGRGWNESSWKKPSLPTRKDLDLITGPDQPTLLWRSDMHCALVNSAALGLAGITRSSDEPEGGRIGRDADGSPNGLLWELAVNLVSKLIPRPTDQEIESYFIRGMSELNRLGVTAIHDQRMKDQTEGPLALTAYQRLQAKGRNSLRINTNIAAHDLPYIRSLGIRSGFGNDYLRIGHLKLFADGTMGSQTAWMIASFSGKDEREKTDLGIILTPPAQMAEEIRTASQLGVPTSVHAIGDKANRVVLDIFEEIGQTGTPTSVPHRIEHVQIIDPEDLPRLASLGLTASVQPTHVLDDMDTADLLLGSRASNAYRFRSLIDSGGLLALGSDAPVADPNPFLGMHAALTRQRPDQMDKGPWYGQERLTMEQTIFGYTMAPAIASGWNNAIGSISPGKRADLIVVDRNPFDLLARGISGSELADTVVQMTIFDGQITEH
jgi:hypothetical protein